MSVDPAESAGGTPRQGILLAAAMFVFVIDTSFMNVDYDIYEGREVAGSPRLTLCRGSVVFDDGRIVTKPGHGRFVRRSAFDRLAI